MTQLFHRHLSFNITQNNCIVLNPTNLYITYCLLVPINTSITYFIANLETSVIPDNSENSLNSTF